MYTRPFLNLDILKYLLYYPIYYLRQTLQSLPRVLLLEVRFVFIQAFYNFRKNFNTIIGSGGFYRNSKHPKEAFYLQRPFSRVPVYFILSFAMLIVEWIISLDNIVYAAEKKRLAAR